MLVILIDSGMGNYLLFDSCGNLQLLPNRMEANIPYRWLFAIESSTIPRWTCPIHILFAIEEKEGEMDQSRSFHSIFTIVNNNLLNYNREATVAEEKNN